MNEFPDPASTVDVRVHPGPESWRLQTRAHQLGNWPEMLGILHMVTAAVHGVPWGDSATRLTMPTTGSVWVQVDGERDIAVVVTALEGRPTADVDGDTWIHHSAGTHKWKNFRHKFRPATVIPTPTADGWRRLADEQPDDPYEKVWARQRDWLPYRDPIIRDATQLDGADWLWQPVPPGVIPPPPSPVPEVVVPSPPVDRGREAK
jgi:hypothetical protein